MYTIFMLTIIIRSDKPLLSQSHSSVVTFAINCDDKSIRHKTKRITAEPLSLKNNLNVPESAAAYCCQIIILLCKLKQFKIISPNFVSHLLADSSKCMMSNFLSVRSNIVADWLGAKLLVENFGVNLFRMY